MGNTGSKGFDKSLLDSTDGERFYGFENFGNTCYCNSVLQCLYFCKPFRERLLDYYASQMERKDPESNLIAAMGDLFGQISLSKKRTGSIAPRKIMSVVRRENEMFRSNEHHDAHEFLNFMLNNICEVAEKEERERAERSRADAMDDDSGGRADAGGQGPNGAAGNGQPAAPVKTWVHEIFQGVMVNETRCLQCDTVTTRDETFLDLSLEIQQNSSLSACLRNFSATEMLGGSDKFLCDVCCSLQEAQKRMRVKQVPPVLLLHLKRFKYIEDLGRIKKLPYRVSFPSHLKVVNALEECEDADAEYVLSAVVVHVGQSPYHGHYISLVKSGSQWVLFDDETADLVDEATVQQTFGSTSEMSTHVDHSFILMYIRKGGPGVWDDEMAAGMAGPAAGGGAGEKTSGAGAHGAHAHMPAGQGKGVDWGEPMSP